MPILPTSTSSSPSPPSTPSNSSQSVEPRPSLQSAQAQIAASETFSSSNVLSPTTISASNQHIYRVLPLSPSATLGQSLIHTSHDLILPPLSAFLSSTYPAFTTVDCTWQYVFDRVVNPSPLWSSYAPGSLGDYPDVKSLWQAWDKGTYVKDIGRKPALRLIDARWGNLESQETHRRKFPSWRPRNDDKARKIWSNFYFFIHRIDSRMKSGHSSDEAVVYFEGLRGGKSLSQLHKSLQTKKRKRRMTDDESS
ncbi:hypothetical protein BDZ97DRAFT_1664085 [Flammula alnicola]|nr:hypothetical protein BDZ97DRAFT_1664085 [Flammula alnicola]